MTKRITPAKVRKMENDLSNLYVPDERELRTRLELQDRLLKLADQMKADAAKKKALAAKHDELAVTNDLFADCMDRACQMWRRAHPDKLAVWPDGATNIVWLVEQHEALAAKLTALEEKMKGRVLVPVKTRTRFGGGYRSDPSCGCCNPTEYLWGVGDTPEEAIANLQAAIDKEGRANG